MRNLRTWNSLRDINITPNFCPNSKGSVLIEMGNTKVICAVSTSNSVPEHAQKKGTGWLTAEYSMLPYSTSPRTNRPLLKKDGRSVEIQRLIGRALRGIIDLTKVPDISFHIDCDVLQADGGTRTASITGSYIALKLSIDKLLNEKKIETSPLLSNIAAISVGSVQNKLLLDLDYSEDSNADVDMNIVMDSNNNLIEVQGTGENTTFSKDQLTEMLELAEKGIKELIDIQNRY